jgi:demethoxyubiquinone hydroxylase (CLK1/Coq7/Cat5 family)
VKTDDTLTVLYDGACPLCRREIGVYRGLEPDAPVCFADVSATDVDLPPGTTRAQLLARFHVRHADGRLESGAAAFVALWSRLPGWRLLAWAARVPGVPWAMERAYRGFLRWRPAMQRRARAWEARTDTGREAEPTASALTARIERDLRSDHAGETGAVAIYAGVLAVTRDPALRNFAQRHQATEREHLRRVEDWLPPDRRSRLLPAWRVAGWLTGALPALFGPRAVYATIAAVETFVDRHYQDQIDHLRAHTGPDDLLPMLQACQADECAHRDEAATAAGGPPGWLLRAWCAGVGAGSAGAVALARRV